MALKDFDEVILAAVDLSVLNAHVHIILVVGVNVDGCALLVQAHVCCRS